MMGAQGLQQQEVHVQAAPGQQGMQVQGWNAEAQNVQQVTPQYPATNEARERMEKVKAIKSCAREGLMRVYANGFKKAVEEIRAHEDETPEWLRPGRGERGARRCFPFHPPARETHTLLKERRLRHVDMMLKNVIYQQEEVLKAAAALACLFQLQPFQVPIVRVFPEPAGGDGVGIQMCQVECRIHLPMSYAGFLSNSWVKEVDSLEVFLAHLTAFEEANATFLVAKNTGIFPGEDRIMNYLEFRHPVSYLLYREVNGNWQPRGYQCAAWDAPNSLIHYN